MNFCTINRKTEPHPVYYPSQTEGLHVHNQSCGQYEPLFQSPTYRNTINNYARRCFADIKIHQASKYAVVGTFASIAGAISSATKTMHCVALSIFKTIGSCCVRKENQQNWRLEAQVDRAQAKIAAALLSYHIVNICTLGFFGFAIGDEKENSTAVYARNCPYGDQDLIEKSSDESHVL